MVSEGTSEKDLLQACINGDKHAWDLFVEQYTNLVYHTIQKIFKIYRPDFFYQDLEDLHNNVFLSLMENDCRKLKQYKGTNGCSVSSWIMVITTNITLNFIMRKKSHISLDDAEDDSKSLRETIADPQPSVIDQVEDSERMVLLKELIEGLSANDKLFLQYYYIEELPPEEIAEIMSITVSAIYSKKSRIIEKLKKIAKRKNLLQGI
ncbi:MAG: sigma-70 family RNA polymerase sigma factor [Nitrospirota bacterium]